MPNQYTVKLRMQQRIKSDDSFGRLVVINFADKTKTGERLINCICACGRSVSVRGSSLLSGKTKSCGCLQKDKVSKLFSKSPGEISYNTLYTTIRNNAKYRGLEFTLTKQQHRKLVSKNCYYDGSAPEKWSPYYSKNHYKKPNSNTLENSIISINGIDRLDSNLGYTYENCVPCCSTCNRGKWELTEQEFIDHCRRVVAFQDNKNAK